MSFLLVCKKNALKHTNSNVSSTLAEKATNYTKDFFVSTEVLTLWVL